MTHYVNFKMPRARKESQFIVYPFTADEKTLKLQSDNHCIIVHVDGEFKGKMFVSKRFNQYPRFDACAPRFGGTMKDTPSEITEQLTKIMETPTGKIVQLT